MAWIFKMSKKPVHHHTSLPLIIIGRGTLQNLTSLSHSAVGCRGGAGEWEGRIGRSDLMPTRIELSDFKTSFQPRSRDLRANNNRDVDNTLLRRRNPLSTYALLTTS